MTAAWLLADPRRASAELCPSVADFGGVPAFGMGSLILGEMQKYGGSQLLSLSAETRRQHIYAIGATGVGKSSLLRALAAQDFDAGGGVAVLDPHGDLAAALVDHIPRWRTDETVIFDPCDQARPPALNLLEPAAADERPLIAAGVVSIMRHIWRDSWGPRSEYIAYNGLAALLDHSAKRGGVSLIGLPRMFTDERFRARVIRDCCDTKVRAFWLDEFANYPERLQAEAVSPLQNKLGQLFNVPILRNVLAQATSTISFDEIINNRRIFIANLSKGRLGESPSSLLGSLLLTGFALAAMRRARLREEEREDFALYVDEFQNFAAVDTFAAVLSEARKYRLSLFLTHQYLRQLPPEMEHAVFGNVGTLISFRVAEADALTLARELTPYPPDTLRELGRGQAIVRTLLDGAPIEPFMLETRPDIARYYGRGANITAQSKQRYTREREEVEGKLQKWFAYK